MTGPVLGWDAPEFGCAACIPTGPSPARVLGLEFVAELIDESHFGLSVRRCPACGQAFVWVFTEQVDWVNGEDPQCSTVMPLEREEAERLIRAGAQVDLAALDALGRARTFLRDDYPSSGVRRCEYTRGPLIGRHD